jgi:hypothetical protein
MNFNRISSVLLATTGILLSGAAQAANQGTLGSTSQGSVSINASVATRVQISGLSDVTFSGVDPSTPSSNNQNVCVWSNTATKGYNITATGDGTANAFTLSSASLPAVPYSVEWAGSSAQTSGTALTKSTALTGLTSTATRAGCAAGPSSSASLIVKMAAADLQSMTAGASYTGTLTLVVAPE